MWMISSAGSTWSFASSSGAGSDSSTVSSAKDTTAGASSTAGSSLDFRRWRRLVGSGAGSGSASATGSSKTPTSGSATGSNVGSTTESATGSTGVAATSVTGADAAIASARTASISATVFGSSSKSGGGVNAERCASTARQPPRFRRRLLGRGFVEDLERGLGSRLDDRVGGDVGDVVERRVLGNFGRRARFFGRGGSRRERGVDATGSLLGPPAPAAGHDRFGVDRRDRLVGRCFGRRDERFGGGVLGGFRDRIRGDVGEGARVRERTGLGERRRRCVPAVGSAPAAISGSGAASTGSS